MHISSCIGTNHATLHEGVTVEPQHCLGEIPVSLNSPEDPLHQSM